MTRTTIKITRLHIKLTICRFQNPVLCEILSPFRNSHLSIFNFQVTFPFFLIFPKLLAVILLLLQLVFSAPWDRIHPGLKNEIIYRDFLFSHYLDSSLGLRWPPNHVYSTLSSLKIFRFHKEDGSKIRVVKFYFPPVIH